MQAAEIKSARLTASPLRLIFQAIGGPRQIAAKLGRLFCTLRLYVSPSEINRRLTTLEQKGYVVGRPTRMQILFGGLDMLRFVIEPAARDYYRQKGISFGFHQLLRVLDDPVSMIDPTGFLSDRDTIVGHVMQVVHLNPVYDLQLIEMFDDGLEDFERQVEAMVRGTPPPPPNHGRDRRGLRLPRTAAGLRASLPRRPERGAAGARRADAARRSELRRGRAHLRDPSRLHRLLSPPADREGRASAQV